MRSLQWYKRGAAYKSDQANVVFDAFDKGSYIQVIPA